MKKIFLLLTATAMLWGCAYDDDGLWNKVDELDNRVEAIEKKLIQINTDIASLQTLTEVLKEGIVITGVTQISNGYTLKFSDDTSVTLTNGTNGTNAPIIGIKDGGDGVYYWTITTDGETEWLLDDNKNKIRVSGENGNPGSAGSAGVTPVLGVDADGYWTVDLGDGATRMLDAQGAPIKAVGVDGESLISSIKESNDSVEIVLANGSTMILPKGNAFDMAIEGINDNSFGAGEVKTYTFTLDNVDDCTIISVSSGWKAGISDKKLSIEAPATFSQNEKNGLIKIHLSSLSGLCRVKKVEVSMFELKILTFEDADYVGSGNYLGNSNWSSLIDNPQYGGSLLYGDYKSCDYNWYDEKNTYLASEFPENFSSKVYWGGGHAISNYVDMNLSNGDFQHQLSVYYQDAKTGFGGHNGSQNFCVQYGYRDNSGYSAQNLPFFYFGDGEARVIDHMYVMNTTYAMNCYIDGNSLTASIGENDWVKLVAIGYNADGKEAGSIEFSMVNGPSKIVSEWTKWDLSSLGKVLKVEFNITGSSDNGYGFSQPAYFAYDDVAVRF